MRKLPAQLEQRRHDRLPMRLRCHLFSRDYSLEAVAWTQDISLGGLYFDSPLEPAWSNKHCLVELLPKLDEPDGAFLMAGVVSDVRSQGAVVRFVMTSMEGYRRLSELLIAHSPDPEGLRQALRTAPGLLRAVS